MGLEDRALASRSMVLHKVNIEEASAAAEATKIAGDEAQRTGRSQSIRFQDAHLGCL